MKKFASLLLVLAMVLGMVACGEKPEETKGSSEADKPKEYKKELTIALEQPVVQFSPAEKSDGNHDKVYGMTFNQLLEWDFEKREFKPELATSVTMPDAHTVSIKLREDVTFSNGEKMTADDVIYTFSDFAAAIKEKNGTVGSSTLVDQIESIDRLGDYEVKLNLKADNVDFIYYLYLYNYTIVCKKACEANLAEGVKIGTGGWMLDEFVAGETLSFKKFNDSWVWKEEGTTPTEKVSFRYYSEISTRVAALESGEVVAAKIGSADLKGIDTSKLEIHEFPAQTLSYALFNFKYGPFAGNDEKTKNLRKAVIYCIDMDELNLINHEGNAVQAKTMWGNAQYGLWEEYDHPYGQDLAYAKECLSKSSYPNGGFSFKLTVPGAAEGGWGRTAVILQSKLKEVLNIDVVIDNTDTAGVTARVKAMREGTATEQDKFDMLIYNISLRPDGGRFNFIPSPTSSTNRALYENDDQVAKFKEALTMTDDAARKEIYKQIQLTWHDESVYWPWFYESSGETCLKGVSGIKWRLDTKTEYYAIKMEVTK